MTRVLLFLTLFAAAAAAADLLVNSTYSQFVVIRNPFENINYTYLYPPRGYLCVYNNRFIINVNNTLYYLSGRSLTAYAWLGEARFCDSSFTSCYIQRGVVFPLRAYVIVESAPRALYVYNSTTGRWELIFNKRLPPGIIASISPTSPPDLYLANLTFIDTVDGELKTGTFSVAYRISSPLTQERGYVVCLRVNETLFPFYSSLLGRTIVPLYTARRGDVYYVMYVDARGPADANGFLFSSAGYYSLINHTTFVVNYYIFKKDFSSSTYDSTSYFYLPVGSKTNAGAIIYIYGSYSLEASFFTEKHYAYYLSKPRWGILSRAVYLVGENNTIVVASFRGDNGIKSYAAFPLCPIDKIIFFVRTFPDNTVDQLFDRYGATLIQNNSTKTLYIMLIESNIYTTGMYKSARVAWVWRVPPGGAAAVPAVAGSTYYRLIFALDSPCVGEYNTFAPIPGYRYIFDGVVFSIVSEGNQTEWIELFKQLLKLLSSLHNQTSTVVKHPQGYTYSGQGIVSVATSLSSSVQLQNVYAFSIATQQGSGMASGGIIVPAVASVALALLLAFAVAVGVAKTREDPADRLAAVYAVFVPTVVMLSLFFASDLATAAVIAAVLIALAYAIHAARL